MGIDSLIKVGWAGFLPVDLACLNDFSIMTSYLSHIRKVIHELGPAEAFTKLIAENNALICCDDLENGRQIVSERTAIYTELVRMWAAEQQARLGYEKPFAVVAVGGTGRGEMTPYSDTDFAFLFDEAIEGNDFLLELQTQVLHTKSFESRYGFRCEAMPFCLDDVPELEGKQLNSFLDMREVYDPAGLTEAFRDRIRATYDPFVHFLHVLEFWRDQWEEAARKSENLDQFDIKNEGLRIFLAGIWTLSGKKFQHSQEIYDTLLDPRDLRAYEFLLRIRAFVHSRRKEKQRPSGGGNHPEDILRFDDFLSFPEMLEPEADKQARYEFGNEVRARLLAARRRVALFANSVIRRDLRRGRVASQNNSIVYGLGGLRIESPYTEFFPEQKSHSAMSLLVASQRYNIPIDVMELQNAFRDAGDWLICVPELASLFYEEHGSMADSFEFLSQIEGAEERLFPGYAKFESSLDKRVMIERQSLRGKLQRQKIRALESFLREGRGILDQASASRSSANPATDVNIAIEAALLDPDHLAAIRLALKTKRLPVTEDDLRIREEKTSSLYERYASGLSGIPLEEYYLRYVSEGGFSEDTIEIVKFLIANRSAFRMVSNLGINDANEVKKFAERCGDENGLRALFVFTCTDRAEWGGERARPALWFNIRELYSKTLKVFLPTSDPTRVLAAAGYAPEQLAILKDFGADFFSGGYRRYANQFGPHLLQLAEDSEMNTPKVAIVRDGSSVILGVATRDFRGLAACISAELWKNGLRITQAHLFSSAHHGLVLDFFHLDTRGKPVPAGLAKQVAEAVSSEHHIDEAEIDQLPILRGKTTFTEWKPGQYCLRFESEEDTGGIMFALVCKLYRHLRANIFALTGHSSNTRAFISIYLRLPDDLSVEDAERLVELYF